MMEQNNNRQPRGSYILMYTDPYNCKKYIFNRHGNSDDWIPAMIRKFYGNTNDVLGLIDIQIIDNVELDNYQLEDQLELNKLKYEYAKIYNASVCLHNEDETFIKKSFMKLKDQISEDNIVNIIKKLWFHFYIKDARYRNIPKEKYFDSVRLDNTEKLVFSKVCDKFNERYLEGKKFPFDKTSNFKKQIHTLYNIK